MRHDRLGHEVDPDARVCALDGVRGQQIRLVRREFVFEKFAEDQRFVERFALVFDCGDEALGVDFYKR